jgi:hypothetical protein
VTVKRRRPEGVPPPERYRRFVRSEWPAGLDCEEAVNFWHRARTAWARDNQYEWQGGITSPLGDALDLLKARREARLMTCIRPDDEEFNGRGLSCL